MLGTPQFGDVKTITNGGIVGTGSPGTALPENATTLLYGADTSLITSGNNVRDSWGIEIMVMETSASAVASEASVDILLDGDTEDVAIQSLLVGGAYAAAPRTFFFPLHIPAGKAISARLASVRTAITDPRILVTLYGGCPPPFRVGHKVYTYGTKINNARGQAVTPTASGGAASVTQMTASTSREHFYFLPGYQVSVDTTIGTATWTNIGIGVGASTEERIGTWWHSKSAAEHQFFSYPTFGAWRSVPAGARLTLLASNGGGNDTDQDGLIYAMG